MNLRIRLVPVALLSFLCAGGVLVVEFGLLRQGMEAALLLILTAICLLPGLFSWIHGRFDPFEPVYPVSLATFIYFGIMAQVVLKTGEVSMLGIDYAAEVPTVIFLATLALASFYATYYSSELAWVDPGPRPELPDDSMKLIRRYSVTLLFIASLMFVSWIIAGRVPLWSMWIFGHASYGTWNIEAAGAKLGYLYAAQEALPACVLLFIASRLKPRWPPMAFFLLGAIGVLFAGLGVRARLMHVLGSAVSFNYLERDTRPRLWHIIGIAFVVFFLIVGAIGHYRSEGASASGPYRLSSARDRFVEGSDILTTSALYVHWVPVYGYDGGRDFFQVLLTPIPTALWPDKYLFFGDSPIEDYRSTGAAAAFFIEFYRSWGPAAVVFGMGLIGWLCRKVYGAYSKNPTSVFAQVSVALLWAYLFHAYGRHSVTLITYGVAYVFAPVGIARWLLFRRRNLSVPDAEHD